MQNPGELIAILYKTKYKKLFNAAYRMTGDSELALDMVQDTFLLALSHQQELVAHPKQEAWLMTTLQNLIRNEHRKFSYNQISLDDITDQSSNEPASPLIDLLPSQLSEDEKKILIWRYEQELNYREIAEHLGISETGSRSRVFRIIAKCRKLLEELDN